MSGNLFTAQVGKLRRVFPDRHVQITVDIHAPSNEENIEYNYFVHHPPIHKFKNSGNKAFYNVEDLLIYVDFVCLALSNPIVQAEEILKDV